MKVISILLISALIIESPAAQNKRDYQWIIGGETGGGGISLNFNQNPVVVTYQQTGLSMDGSNTSMADENGNLMFSSNGCKIVNAKDEVMENGDDINPGLIQNSFCSPVSGSPLVQGVIALPSPVGDSIYYIFNLDYDQPYVFEKNFYGLAPQRLYYQKIDMAQDSGLGAVVQKNQIALMDTFARGYIQAIRHANGKDWWVIVPKSHSNCYFLLPITEDGIQPALLKCSGKVWTDEDYAAQTVFTPDGKKYIRFNGWNGLNIFDFDTATGDLSNPLNIMFPTDTINYIAGVAVSPNSRYLYVCARKNIYQFDLKNVNIEASKIKIATWDGYQNPYSTLFYLAALAPDGKIYISNASSTFNLHVINKPNCSGIACELVQHGIMLPAYNFATIPNMPHYRKSYYECDSTLVEVNSEYPNQPRFSISPNPASHSFTLRGTWEGTATVSLCSMDGRAVLSQHIAENEASIVLPTGILAGIYVVKVRTARGFTFVAKLAVQPE